MSQNVEPAAAPGSSSSRAVAPGAAQTGAEPGAVELLVTDACADVDADVGAVPELGEEAAEPVVVVPATVEELELAGPTDFADPLDPLDPPHPAAITPTATAVSTQAARPVATFPSYRSGHMVTLPVGYPIFASRSWAHSFKGGASSSTPSSAFA
ncbi:MAG: hypothetical protein JF587_11535 [Catenulisporales bacterium]|nr:hypothetical protein [Catenulisporales bacterium]